MITTQRAAALCFALFVFAGYYKAADPLRFVPFDLTLLFWVATAGFCLHAIWRQRRLPPGTLPLLLVFAAMAIGLHWPGELGAYAAQKELRLFSLTALAAAAPLLLLQRHDERRVFLFAIGVLGAAMAVAATLEIAVAGKLTRVSAFNTNPILLARASGFTTLLLCMLYWLGRIRLWLFLPAAAVGCFAVLISGSRGPLLALLATGAMVAALCAVRAEARMRIAGTLVAGTAALAAAVLAMGRAQLDAGNRLLRLLTGEWGDTEFSRFAIWRETLDLIPTSPLGLGWGRLSERLQVWQEQDDLLLLHPHNIVLEIAVEAGWLAAAAFLLLLGAIALRSFRLTRQQDNEGADCPIRTLVVFGALAYWFLCAAVSGDVNDNRTLWSMIGMTLAALGSWRVVRVSDDRNGGESFGSRGRPE